LAVVVAKASAVFDAAGRMTLDLGIHTPVCHEPVPHAQGQLPADVALGKQGMDVLALGQAYHPKLEGGAQSEVVVQVDRRVRRLQVFGERYWYKSSLGEWSVSRAENFSLLSLSWRNAFGGASFDEQGNPCPHGLNPEGKGFVASEAAIDGTALPNLEDPEHPISNWRDQPHPCNLAPAPRHLAVDVAELAAEVERTRRLGEPYAVPDSLWNDAIPRFRFDGVAPGAAVSLSGMSETPLYGALPTFRLYADARVGDGARRVPLRLDTVLFLPEARRVLFTFRGSFVYRFHAREARRVTLTLEG
jgi:Uncharacterized protein conserved in bacteria (DUF2169)